MLSGSRTRAERLAKDLSEEGLNAFYSQDMDRIISPGEIMVVYGHARRGFQYPLIKICSDDGNRYFRQRAEKSVKKRKSTAETGSRILQSFPLVILLFMKSTDWVFTVESKR